MPRYCTHLAFDHPTATTSFASGIAMLSYELQLLKSLYSSYFLRVVAFSHALDVEPSGVMRRELVEHPSSVSSRHRRKCRILDVKLHNTSLLSQESCWSRESRGGR